MKKDKVAVVTIGSALALAAFAACAKIGEGAKDATTRNSESSVTTNENGSVSRVFTECTVTTNGNMVTEHRRETRTNTDTEGNVLETSTSEYAQSYSVGGLALPPKISVKVSSGTGAAAEEEAPAANADSFMGRTFGEKIEGTNFVADAAEPTLLRATFTPKKPLANFDDYFVYVTPTTHRVAKVFACAKDAVEPGARWRRHYLIEALEKRYQTWARLCSYRRPCYSFDLGGGRYVTACLAGASREYETILAAWDDAMLTEAADETEAIREAARKSAAEARNNRVKDAADAF